VGYVNKVITGNQYSMLNSPLSNGANDAAAIFGTQLPDGTQLYQWNGANFVVSTYDTTIGADTNNWYNGDESATAPTPVILPGQGYFLFAFHNFTNTFTGSVVVGPGVNTNNFALANQYNMLGSLLPIAGSVDSTNINFFPPDGTQLYQWNGSSYTVSTYDTSIGADVNNWYNGDESATAPTPTVSVGEGLFVFPFSPWTWTEHY
jgi:hypothetical protein